MKITPLSAQEPIDTLVTLRLLSATYSIRYYRPRSFSFVMSYGNLSLIRSLLCGYVAHPVVKMFLQYRLEHSINLLTSEVAAK